MKGYVTLAVLPTLLCLTLAVVPAMATPANTIFQTGGGTGTSGDNISMTGGPDPGNIVDNLFSCPVGPCTITGFTFGIFNPAIGGANPVPTSISWLFSGAKPFNFKNVCGGGSCSGTTSSITQIGTDCLPVCLESVTLPTPITVHGGSQWFNLYNETDNTPSPGGIVWSTNNGTGQLSSSLVLPKSGGINHVGPPGDAFGIFGTSTPVPEPSGILLLGSGLLGAAGVLRRKLIR